MKLHQDNSGDSLNLIKAYAAGVITINETAYQNSLIISPDSILEDWAPCHHSELEPHHCQQILDTSPEIVLIGTGNQQHFPQAVVLQPLLSAGIGVEIMATDAACRTYNILASEGRRVVAGLIMLVPD